MEILESGLGAAGEEAARGGDAAAVQGGTAFGGVGTVGVRAENVKGGGAAGRAGTKIEFGWYLHARHFFWFLCFLFLEIFLLRRD